MVRTTPWNDEKDILDLMPTVLSPKAVVHARTLSLSYTWVRTSYIMTSLFFIADLLRLFLAFYIISLVFFVAAYVFGLILCCWRVSRWAYIAGLCAYISGRAPSWPRRSRAGRFVCDTSTEFCFCFVLLIISAVFIFMSHIVIGACNRWACIY